MLLEIEHKTKYSYSKPVFLEPHFIRLRPRSDSTQKVYTFNIEFSPEPIGKTDCVDIDGNDTVFIWFEDLKDELVITAKSRVETLRTNPYEFLVNDYKALKLPLKYSDELKIPLSPYIRTEAKNNSEIDEFSRFILHKAGNQTLNFLSELNTYFHKNFKHINREIGNPWNPHRTLEKKKGSCRDLVVLFMECCGIMGLASRFVSGYKEVNIKTERRELHAWVEIYIPGGGWRGYDPSLGLAVADSHIILAAGPSYQLASPLSGNYRGDDVKTEFESEILIDLVNQN